MKQQDAIVTMLCLPKTSCLTWAYHFSLPAVRMRHGLSDLVKLHMCPFTSDLLGWEQRFVEFQRGSLGDDFVGDVVEASDSLERLQEQVLVILKAAHTTKKVIVILPSSCLHSCHHLQPFS